ncbi:uncharacterized protein [Spinacia oleracea]|uniref:No apical meristem-associated C-terminal domain-containing protein n=1 Tax=Spinacia oleracea TaxID=3562 RepID=A0ABM3RPV8_SPIOL|nr:uncharacterized protein LOC130471494 [Spinacia oleracea]
MYSSRPHCHLHSTTSLNLRLTHHHLYSRTSLHLPLAHCHHTATGACSHPSTKSPSESEDEDDTDAEVGDVEKQCEEGPKTKKAKTSINPKTLRAKVNTALADALVAMSENSKKKLELLEKKYNVSNEGGQQSKEEDDLLMECIDSLSALKGIDGASFAKATKLIHDDPLWRKMFLRFPNDRKIDFVLNI